MANSQAMCTSFKAESWLALHALGTTVTRAGTGADTIKAALYLASGSLGAATTAYSATSEVSNSGTYSAGGTTVTNGTAPTTSGTSAIWTPTASFQWTGFTAAAFDTVLLYNSTQSNRAISVHTFGSQTVTAGTFTLTMPSNTVGNALLQLS